MVCCSHTHARELRCTLDTISQVSYIKQTEFMAANASGLAHKLGLHVGAGRQQQQQVAAADGGGSSKKKRKQQQQEQVSQLQAQLQELGLFDKHQAEVAAAIKLRTKLLRKLAEGDASAEQQLQEQLPLMARYDGLYRTCLCSLIGPEAALSHAPTSTMHLTRPLMRWIQHGLSLTVCLPCLLASVCVVVLSTQVVLICHGGHK